MNTENTNNKWKTQKRSKEDFELNHKIKNYYNIFYNDKSNKMNIVYQFWADNDDAAYDVLCEYKSENPPAPNGEYYYGYCGFYPMNDKQYSCMDEYLSDYDENIIEKIKAWFEFYFVYKVKDFFHALRDAIFLLKTNHNYYERWSIDTHIIDDLRFNLPIMIENLHGCPESFCERASESSEIKDERPVVSEKGVELWREELTKLLENVLLYKYYDGYGIVDEKDKQMVEIHKKYESTLPYVKGTYKQLEYSKLRELINKHWEFICDWMKEHGRDLWD